MNVLNQTPPTPSNKTAWVTWADWTGLAASIACGIHCAAMPLLLSYLPSFGLSWLAHEGFHQWMTVACFLFAAAAFVPGWRKHKSLVPAFSGVIGITLLSLSAFVFGDECCAAAAQNQGSQSAACTDAACTDAACTDAACTDAACTDAACADAACADAACTARSEEEIGQSPEVSTQYQFATFTNWLSPLGGLFLVIGHIANHRKNCTCSSGHCCLDGEQSLKQLTKPEK
ncbi:MAG: MerC domain-containing protein [Planctomycetota bacterium]|nr:MerC domain-containing protein [Planctomycetota bacterium]